MTRRIYVASSWRNKSQPDVVRRLRAAGHDVYDFRSPAPGDDGFHWSELDRDWLTWTPRQYLEHIETHPRAASGFANDKAALDWADTCVLVQPCGISAHLELGYMAGQGKPTTVLMSADRFEPELMYLLMAARHCTVEGVLDWLDGLEDGGENAVTVGDWYLSHAPGAVHARPADLACRLLQEAVELCIAAGADHREVRAAVAEEVDKTDQRGEWGGDPAAEPVETADVQIQLWAYARARGIDLPAMVDFKMAINRARTWHVTDKGTLYHRTPPAAAE